MFCFMSRSQHTHPLYHHDFCCISRGQFPNQVLRYASQLLTAYWQNWYEVYVSSRGVGIFENTQTDQCNVKSRCNFNHYCDVYLTI